MYISPKSNQSNPEEDNIDIRPLTVECSVWFKLNNRIHATSCPYLTLTTLQQIPATFKPTNFCAVNLQWRLLWFLVNFFSCGVVNLCSTLTLARLTVLESAIPFTFFSLWPNMARKSVVCFVYYWTLSFFWRLKNTLLTIPRFFTRFSDYFVFI